MIGTRLGPYEILSALGAGGMGEVYRARDTQLKREVAIKVLPQSYAADPDRLARFQREAELLATLNHPNIAAVYGLEKADPSPHSASSGQAGSGQGGVTGIVLELIEGETLADLITRGPIAIADALPIARQIADALEAAHEKGVIHRDLKPANIKITPDGHVKVLDFGLAKLTESAGSGQPGSAHLSLSPTITSPAMMTGMGMILGTAAYMAPEQAKGKPADKRSDIWAFGAVLYEMLTGKRAFEGEDISDTLANVLKREPDWDALPSDLPPAIQTVVQRCLIKERRNRLADISVVQFLLTEPAGLAAPAAIDAAAASQKARPAARVWQAAAALLALTTIAGATAWWSASRSITPSVTRFFVYPPEKSTFVTFGRTAFNPTASVVISPDGSKLAFTARDASGKVLLWMRPIDSLAAQPLPGTDEAVYPFWSPDSRFIAYFARQKLLTIAATGGPPQTVCDTGLVGNRGGTWGPDGTIVFSTGPGRTLSRVSSAGGQPSEFMRLAKGQTIYASPWFLPDGRHFLFYANATSDDVAGVYVGSLDATESTRLAGADSAAVYDSKSRHLLFLRRGTLIAQPFDPDTLALTGESFPIAERVESGLTAGVAAFAVSNNGILAYGVNAGAAAGLQMAWFDRDGKQVEAVGPPANYLGLDLAPDGKRVAAHRHDGDGGDIWMTDLARRTTSRFTFNASQENSSPIWSPDGTRIVYSSIRDGKWGLYQKLANNSGSEQRLVESDTMTIPVSWSPDGSLIVYEVFDPRTGSPDLWVVPLSDDGRKPSALLHTPFAESHGQISPDGKWLAYYSNETGATEIYVQPFPGGAGKWQISTNGGLFPRWRRDGRELFYMTQNGGGKMMAVDIRSNGSMFDSGTPKELFDSPYVAVTHNTPAGVSIYHPFAVSADGQRFLIPHSPSGDNASLTMPIAVVENWAAGLRK